MVMDLFLAFYSSMGGGAIGQTLAQWEQAGVFSYLLPFLLIFVLVYGMLSAMKLFENQGVNIMISLAIGLMALQFNFVSVFFSEIFPRMGVGLSIVLVVLIIVGFFAREDDGHGGTRMAGWFKTLMAIVGGIVVLFIVLGSFQDYGWYSNIGGIWYLVRANFGGIVLGAIILIVVIMIFKPRRSAGAPPGRRGHP